MRSNMRTRRRTLTHDWVYALEAVAEAGWRGGDDALAAWGSRAGQGDGSAG